MKKNNFLKQILSGALLIAVAAGFTSCKKDDVDETGSARIKVVNASSASIPQSVFLANSAIVQGGLAFNNSSDYITTNSGNNLQLEFRNEGSTTAYASGRFDVDNGSSYTAFLAGDGQQARVKFYKDDLSAPAGGQAKVRFVHLSDAAPANVDIRRSSGANLAANLAKDNASNFMNIEPGILSLQVYSAGGTQSLGTFNLSSFAEGRIYTVYITGSTTQNIAVRQITHN
ncbi:DUF4397 domain-containing protein [Pedobacter puniceum]|uniref:DUF4397 domain-containing protein n=1 Tax=Pedobacter puniceum TaxID=2666136 RepID=A0A7K0FTN6_9SPHI|nr:DUF4397 domain-containing protein [Pedobacter puniceum]MRX48710.1 DUF4397 domain-containing protein [Pedobacter puniceum]